MKRSRRTRDEPGVTEVRRWRAKLWKQGGGTIRGVMDLLRAASSRRAATTKKPSRRRSA